MTEILKSASFPNGLPPARSEDEVRAARQASLEVRHTGGPWQSKHSFDRDGELTIIGNVDGEYVDGVAQCTYDLICEVDDNKDGIANARLITAAPDLLKACREALNWMEPDSYSPNAAKARAQVAAAIAKAEGRLP